MNFDEIFSRLNLTAEEKNIIIKLNQNLVNNYGISPEIKKRLHLNIEK